ncbi:MAG: hypothetical protein CMJ49_09915 [Planctomycetaceae bacterium]|nr:hypothetical protein [Planctomycetaceae bacterium]
MAPHIHPYTTDDLESLHAIYHETVVGRVPHCWPVAVDNFAEVLAAPPGQVSYDATLSEQAVLVGQDTGEPRGFIHVGVQAPHKHEPQPLGVIRFLAYHRRARKVGDALLTAAHQWLRERNIPRAIAFCDAWRYPFLGFAHGCLSDHLDHVQALLRVRRYQKSGGEVFLDWPNMNPVAPPRPNIDFTLEWHEPTVPGCQPRLILNATDGSEILGACELRSGSDFSDHPDAAAFTFCDELWVVDPLQGRGLGKFLLATALIEARQRRHPHASISTAVDNHRAFQFYTHHGFHVADWTYEFARDLT